MNHYDDGQSKLKIYQSQKNAEELNDIRVSDRVKSSHQCVEDCYERRHHHWHADVYVDNHTQCGTCTTNTQLGLHHPYSIHTFMSFHKRCVTCTVWLSITHHTRSHTHTHTQNHSADVHTFHTALNTGCLHSKHRFSRENPGFHCWMYAVWMKRRKNVI